MGLVQVQWGILCRIGNANKMNKSNQTNDCPQIPKFAVINDNCRCSYILFCAKRDFTVVTVVTQFQKQVKKLQETAENRSIKKQLNFCPKTVARRSDDKSIFIFSLQLICCNLLSAYLTCKLFFTVRFAVLLFTLSLNTLAVAKPSL